MSPYPLLTLRILSPDGISIEETGLNDIRVPLADGGSIGIKPGHTPLIAETIRGAIRFSSETEEQSIEIHPGVLDIRDNTVIILTAGKVSDEAGFVAEPTHLTLDRLMQTLVIKIHPNVGTATGDDHHG